MMQGAPRPAKYDRGYLRSGVRDGTEKTVSFILLSLSSGEDMVTCEDITERRRAEDLAIRTERLKAIGDLAGGVAHNFNNLLQMVMGASTSPWLIWKWETCPDSKKTLEELLKSSRLGAETVRRLQSFAQVRGESKPLKASVDLSETVKQAAENNEAFLENGP